MKSLLKHFSTDIDKKQATDTGMAMVLILLLIGYFTGEVTYFKLSIPILILNMIYPMLFYPLAIFWFGLSHLIGGLVSKVLLTLVFFTILLPIGLIRRILGKDSLHLKAWKKDSTSAMTDRNKTFTSEDLVDPF
jgi:polyferredoxin